MRKIHLTLAAAVVALFSVVAPSPAHAYPGVTVTVTDDEVVGGNTATVTASVDPDVDCTWVVKYRGQVKGGSGSEITVSFETREVDETESDPVTATCTYDDSELASMEVVSGGSKGSLGASLVAAPQESSGSGTITLLPEGEGDGDGGDGDGDGLLPNTGGERLAWLIIGGLLVLVGGGVVAASRRRNA